MSSKVEIIICMGSSCFIRGNRILADKLQRYIIENNLADKVLLKGNLCFAECGTGPLVFFGDERVEVETDQMYDYIINKINEL